LKLVVDKEREIEAFKPEEYWTIKAIFNDFEADLFKYKEKDIKIQPRCKTCKRRFSCNGCKWCRKCNWK